MLPNWHVPSSGRNYGPDLARLMRPWMDLNENDPHHCYQVLILVKFAFQRTAVTIVMQKHVRVTCH